MYKSDEIKSTMIELIKGPNAQKFFTALSEAVIVAGKLPIRLTGELAAVNPLIWLSQENPAEYASLIEFIHEQRSGLGVEPLDPKRGKFQKNRYQAIFMAEGRARRGRASAIENMTRPPRDKLIGSNRMDFERNQQATWKKQRDASIAAHKAANGGRITKTEMNALVTRFWAAVDTALDEKEAEARRNRIG